MPPEIALSCPLLVLQILGKESSVGGVRCSFLIPWACVCIAQKGDHGRKSCKKHQGHYREVRAVVHSPLTTPHSTLLPASWRGYPFFPTLLTSPSLLLPCCALASIPPTYLCGIFPLPHRGLAIHLHRRILDEEWADDEHVQRQGYTIH